MPGRLLASVVAAGLAAAGCSQGDGPSRRPGTIEPAGPEENQARCDALRPRVVALYRASTPAPGAASDPALAADLAAADVTMVLADCRADPDRVVPCVERARDVAEVETRCLIPLDEEGAVDGDRLRSR